MQKSSSQRDATTTSNSASSLLSTLIPVALTAAVFTILFLILRSKQQRIYRPRTYLATLHENEKTTKLPDGRFSWIKPFRGIPDDYVLNHQSLDGYLYLRYFKMLTIICFVGCLITWPVLFPVNATSAGGLKQLDLLTFSNVTKSQKKRYYAHTFVAWIFFGFVMYMITRETMYFINLRHAYLLSPVNAQRISSRTVLFTFVPSEYLRVDKLQELFGRTMKRAWLATDCKKLEKEVEERDKVAMKLETAEVKLSQAANKRRLKDQKKGKGTTQTAQSQAQTTATSEGITQAHPTADAEAGVVSSPYLVKKDRPSHRTDKIPLIGKKVDTIDWCRTELGRLILEVEKTQTSLRAHKGKIVPAVFVEFHTQLAAEAAFRRMTPRKAPHMTPRAISTPPNMVVWKNLGMSKSQRKIRVILTSVFLTLMILYWAIPVAVVGAISNINYLTDKVHFLSFINKIPTVILGVVTGLLPSILLSVLMSLVPIVCRWMAKLSGEVTLPQVELKCQNWYFAFQVIQVFIITTFSSGAAAVVTKIIKTPSSATTLLAQNLPKASNFYISYLIVQGLGVASGNLLNIGGLIGFLVLGKFFDKSPRKMFKRYITLAGLGWGSLYPKFGCLAVIALSYSCIAPLVLGFATIGFLLIYLATRYNVFFVLGNSVPTNGLAYSKAMQQLFVGLYIAEICLLGLFAINTAPGPIVLMAFFLGLTAVYHAIMRHALKPLSLFLPDSLEAEDQVALFHTIAHRSYDVNKAVIPPSGEASATAEIPTKGFAARKSTLFARIFNPRKFTSHDKVRSLIPGSTTAIPEGGPVYASEEYEEEKAYFHPAIASERPRLWIVRDEMGISRKEVADSKNIAGVDISDEGAWLNEKGKVEWDREHAEKSILWKGEGRF